MSTTLAEFQRWLNHPREDGHLEFKEAKDHYGWDKLYRYCIALANEGGGKLILGVTDRKPRQVVGSQAFPDTAQVQTQVLDKLGFRVEAEALLPPMLIVAFRLTLTAAVAALGS